MSFPGLLPSQDTDQFVLEPQLVVRLVQEGYIGADVAAVVRARTRWRSKDTLDSSDWSDPQRGEPRRRLRDDRRALAERAAHERAPGLVVVVERARRDRDDAGALGQLATPRRPSVTPSGAASACTK